MTNIKHDFQRLYEKMEYKGKIRKIFSILLMQGFQAVLGYRICRWLVLRRIPILHVFIQKWVELTTSISISPTAKIGKGLLIEHFSGIVINSKAKIGDNCTLTHGVTIGNKIPGGKAPQIGNNVYICVDAKILGDITIGDNCIIGAGAVLFQSIPANSIAAGIPAKVVKKI